MQINIGIIRRCEQSFLRERLSTCQLKPVDSVVLTALDRHGQCNQDTLCLSLIHIYLSSRSSAPAGKRNASGEPFLPCRQRKRLTPLWISCTKTISYRREGDKI